MTFPFRVWTLVVFLSFETFGFAQRVITTTAGTDWIFPADGAAAATAPIGRVVFIALSPDSGITLSDVDNFMVMNVSTDGVVHVVAGNGILGFSGIGGSARSASLRLPRGLAYDASGNLYVALSLHHRVIRIKPDGTMDVAAGVGSAGYSGDGGPATSAQLNGPTGLASDASGNIYIADSENHVIRVLSSSGVITTVAGNGQKGSSGDGGPAVRALLNSPFGVLPDGSGGFWIADTLNHRVRRVSAAGVISTVAGTGAQGFGGDGGPAVSGVLYQPTALAQDTAGRLYVADAGNHCVRRIADGVITTFAGNRQIGATGDGGPATSATLNFPTGVAADRSGNLYIADFQNARVRRVGSNGIITTVAGNGTFRLSPDGIAATSAALHIASGIALDPAGNLYIAENQRPRVRRVGANGVIQTIAGNGQQGFSGEGVAATTASLFSPSRVAVDRSGNLFVSDNLLNRIRRVTPAGIIQTVAGTGLDSFAGDNGPATSAALHQPEGIALDAAGNLYIADFRNNRVRRVNTAGTITTVAGNGQAASTGDGGPATAAALNAPVGVALDARGNLYISERFGNRVRMVNATGTISTFAGNGQPASTGDGGVAASASLNQPAGMDFDAQGNFYVAELFGNRVRMVTPQGTITTVAGSGADGFTGDGGAATSAQLFIPSDVKVDAAGNIIIADAFNNRIRTVLSVRPSFQAPATLQPFSASEQGAPPPAQTIDLTPSVSGLPFSVSVTASGGDWLSVSPTDGRMPASLTVAVDPKQLTAGSYTGTITISAPLANPATRTVAVQLTVESAVPPRLESDAARLSFSFTEGDTGDSQALQIRNAGGGQIAYAATARTVSGGDWLTVGSERGEVAASAPAALQVRANPAGLAAGTYLGSINVTGSGGSAAVTSVTMTVSAGRQRVLLSQSGLTFTAVAGGGTPPPQTFGVLNVGTGVINWTVSVRTAAAAGNWLSVTPSAGSTNASSLQVPLVTVAVDASRLSPGDYYGEINVSAGSADNSPQTVSVVLNVLPAGSDPGPLVRPTGLIFTGLAGDTPPGSQTIRTSVLSNQSNSFIAGNLTLDGRNWFVAAPPSGTVAPGRPFDVIVQPDLTGLSPGIYRGALTLLFADGHTSVVNLLFLVAGAGINQSAKGVRSADGCTASRLLPLFTQLNSSFTVPAGWPATIEVRVVDDCGQQLVSGSVVATFSNGDPPLYMAPLKDGRWAGAWQPRNQRTPQVTVTVNAENPGAVLRGSIQITGGIQPNADPPVISAGGVVNAASRSGDSPLALGSLVSVLGSKLADQSMTVSEPPLPTDLAGTSVLIAGQSIPLLSVKADQIDAIVPFDIPINARHQLVVRRGATVAVPETVTVSQNQPAAFTKDGSGKGQGSILDENQQYAEPGHAARRGQTVGILCSGLGPVDPPVPIGLQTPSSPPSTVTSPITVRIGDVETPASFAGLAPGLIGVYRVDVVVPANAPVGDAIPVVIQMGGQQSSPVTMAVQAE
ncbi:MAG TPA: hypothetical protein VL285_19985 [Bryobacteraceae bacterium]|nr:hypothetical protein [Bryobacteraceae bacterium]